MIAFFGFNKKVGNISFYDSTGRTETSLQKPYSEETAKLIDDEVRLLVDECYSIAREILRAHKHELQTLAEMLLEREVIFKEDVEKVLGPRRTHTPTPQLLATNY